MGEISWWLCSTFRVLINILISQVSCNICALLFQGKTCTQIWPHQRPQTCRKVQKSSAPASTGSSLCTALTESNQKLGLQRSYPRLHFQNSRKGEKQQASTKNTVALGATGHFWEPQLQVLSVLLRMEAKAGLYLQGHKRLHIMSAECPKDPRWKLL